MGNVERIDFDGAHQARARRMQSPIVLVPSQGVRSMATTTFRNSRITFAETGVSLSVGIAMDRGKRVPVVRLWVNHSHRGHMPLT